MLYYQHSQNYLIYFFDSYFDKIQYTNVVFKNTNKPMIGNIKSLTKENLQENIDNLQLSGNNPRAALTSTDSDYLSTMPPTEMTEMTNNYKSLDGKINHNVHDY